jgi:hypothetical protein
MTDISFEITGKSSAQSSDDMTTADEENEETRLIGQSKLYIEGPGQFDQLSNETATDIVGLRTNYKKIDAHNQKIGEKLKNLRGEKLRQRHLPSPILTRSSQTREEVIIMPAQCNSRK